MKRITKHCKTLAQAERYLNRLYDRYEYVQLVEFPVFTESGLYVWQVR